MKIKVKNKNVPLLKVSLILFDKFLDKCLGTFLALETDDFITDLDLSNIKQFPLRFTARAPDKSDKQQEQQQINS